MDFGTLHSIVSADFLAQHSPQHKEIGTKTVTRTSATYRQIEMVVQVDKGCAAGLPRPVVMKKQFLVKDSSIPIVVGRDILHSMFSVYDGRRGVHGLFPPSALEASHHTAISPQGASHARTELLRLGPRLEAALARIPNASTPFGPQWKTLPCLVDTGCSHSFIDNQVAQDLQLPVCSTANVVTFRGTSEEYIFAAKIRLSSVGYLADRPLVAMPQSGLHTSVTDHCKLIIGRDIAAQLGIFYDGHNGAVSFYR